MADLSSDLLQPRIDKKAIDYSHDTVPLKQLGCFLQQIA